MTMFSTDIDFVWVMDADQLAVAYQVMEQFHYLSKPDMLAVAYQGYIV